MTVGCARFFTKKSRLRILGRFNQRCVSDVGHGRRLRLTKCGCAGPLSEPKLPHALCTSLSLIPCIDQREERDCGCNADDSYSIFQMSIAAAVATPHHSESETYPGVTRMNMNMRSEYDMYKLYMVL